MKIAAEHIITKLSEYEIPWLTNIFSSGLKSCSEKPAAHSHLAISSDFYNRQANTPIPISPHACPTAFKLEKKNLPQHSPGGASLLCFQFFSLIFVPAAHTCQCYGLCCCFLFQCQCWTLLKKNKVEKQNLQQRTIISHFHLWIKCYTCQPDTRHC